MKPLKQFFIVWVFSISVISCSNGEVDKSDQSKPETTPAQKPAPVSLESLRWMEGNWIQESENSDIVMRESWTFSGDTLITGHGEEHNEATGTGFKEDLRIFSRNDTVYYAPLVEGQNNGKEVLFRLVTEMSSDSIVFENKKHDFPQVITYVKRSDSVMWVNLRGLEGAIETEFSLDFVREK